MFMCSFHQMMDFTALKFHFLAPIEQLSVVNRFFFGQAQHGVVENKQRNVSVGIWVYVVHDIQFVHSSRRELLECRLVMQPN
jgi:hypothetical protein